MYIIKLYIRNHVCHHVDFILSSRSNWIFGTVLLLYLYFSHTVVIFDSFQYLQNIKYKWLYSTFFVFDWLPRKSEIRGWILGSNWDRSFPPCYSQSALLTDFSPPPPPPLPWAKVVWNWFVMWTLNIVCGNLKSGNSRDYVQKRNCTFMNSASIYL
jgi:hypothetical protein